MKRLVGAAKAVGRYLLPVLIGALFVLGALGAAKVIDLPDGKGSDGPADFDDPFWPPLPTPPPPPPVNHNPMVPGF
ncbi:hypothetical protein C3489_00795 [Streptomyces sp. Ru71]|uniref:hypothetical protein n=1 Tax=Streptomyces sp. Ru71 TaxID=2080746 RepID=UPI000CDD57B6|nr:hypothetical protein [Streptomyces sp. Ru71]POX57283.1 hypothetical protein C3489_00795 [Streptomyces sp. Ru71]